MEVLEDIASETGDRALQWQLLIAFRPKGQVQVIRWCELACEIQSILDKKEEDEQESNPLGGVQKDIKTQQGGEKAMPSDKKHHRLFPLCRQALELARAYQYEFPPSWKPWNLDATREKDLTLVTALYNIRDIERAVAAAADTNGAKGGVVKLRGVEDYLKLGEEHVLKWDVNLVIFTELPYVKRIREIRQRYGLLDKTYITHHNITDSPLYQRFYVKKLRPMFEEEKRIPQGFNLQKDTPLYIWLTAQKFFCLESAMEMNLFQSTRFGWVDFGLGYISPCTHPQELLRECSNVQSIRAHVILPIDHRLTHNRKEWYSRLRQAIGGGFFIGPVDDMKWLIRAFLREFQHSLEFFPALEESILGVIFSHYPERFAPIDPVCDGHREMTDLHSDTQLWERISRHLLARTSSFKKQDDHLLWTLLGQYVGQTGRHLHLKKKAIIMNFIWSTPMRQAEEEEK